MANADLRNLLLGGMGELQRGRQQQQQLQQMMQKAMMEAQIKAQFQPDPFEIVRALTQPGQQPAWTPMPQQPGMATVPGPGGGRIRGRLPQELVGQTPPTMPAPPPIQQLRQRGFKPSISAEGRISLAPIEPPKPEKPATRLQTVNLAKSLAGTRKDYKSETEWANAVNSWIPIAEGMLKEPGPRKGIPGRGPAKTRGNIIGDLKALRAKGASLSDLYAYLQYEGYTEPIKRTLKQTLPFGAGVPIRAGRALGETFERFRK